MNGCVPHTPTTRPQTLSFSRRLEEKKYTNSVYSIMPQAGPAAHERLPSVVVLASHQNKSCLVYCYKTVSWNNVGEKVVHNA